jgi:hypothetical protein
MTMIRSLLALAMLVVSQAAAATACLGPSPFDDIAQNDPICSNADWLKNRGVTLGCTAELYCPLDPVSRAQMALFMNRLAIALVPSVNVTSDVETSVDLDTASFHCVTPTYTITDFARKMVLIGHLTALLDASGSLTVTIVYNTTGSASVFPEFTTDNLERASAGGVNYAHASTSAAIDLEVGTSYRFAIRTLRQGGTGEMSNMRCNLLQMLQPRERNSILP